MFECKHFVKDHLFSTVDNQASCPFGDNICRSNNSNIRLDTGYLSLANDLGSNAPPDQDILLRTVLHCAPLKTRGYQQSVHLPMEDFVTYHYGAFPDTTWNYTYMIKSLDSQYKRESGNPFRGEGNGFVLGARKAGVYKRKGSEDNTVIRAIPALFTPDADTILVFLTGNGIEFFQETNDPWYHATVPGSNVSLSGADGPSITVYQPDEASSPMGCTSQFQYCNTSLSMNKCGPLASIADAMTESAPLFGMSTAEYESTSQPNGTMISRYQWLVMMMNEAAVHVATIINTLGPDSLVSPKYLINGLMGPLPDAQWQVDVQNWWAIFLASLQAGVVGTALASVDPALDPYKIPPYNSDLHSMCKNQKIRSTRHVSFSLFGLYFTYTTGIFIIITSFIIEPIFTCLYKRRKYQEYTYLEWATSETLQLQRIGFQGNNDGTWSGCTDPVPRTKPGEMLKSLAVRYSSDSENNCESGSTSNRTNLDTADGSIATHEYRDAEMISLDDFMDVSSFTDGDSALDQAAQNSEQNHHISAAPQYHFRGGCFGHI
ncbi:hypothetical protein KVR01_009283 [Diaporthe batatas]|uniref:uncharacterized protein n=1 Tax=Diaporthe batatas TaxID=748121 RepID=UPI001D05C1B0|nr:uncharacterized protein KVR01_009283 [Diaporthe batatas]KAG8161019.1 hypothetical protein KVR01_009283 [Diaporthe batatas]